MWFGSTHNISEKLHFFGRAMQDETPENFPEGLFAGAQFPGVAGSAVNAPGENVVGNLTWTISPRMVNEAEFAYTQGTISSDFESGTSDELANGVQGTHQQHCIQRSLWPYPEYFIYRHQHNWRRLQAALLTSSATWTGRFSTTFP